MPILDFPEVAFSFLFFLFPTFVRRLVPSAPSFRCARLLLHPLIHLGTGYWPFSKKSILSIFGNSEKAHSSYRIHGQCSSSSSSENISTIGIALL